MDQLRQKLIEAWTRLSLAEDRVSRLREELKQAQDNENVYQAAVTEFEQEWYVQIQISLMATKDPDSSPM